MHADQDPGRLLLLCLRAAPLLTRPRHQLRAHGAGHVPGHQVSAGGRAGGVLRDGCGRGVGRAMEVFLEKRRGGERAGLKAALRLSLAHPAQETTGSHRCGHQHARGRALGQRALWSHRAAEVAVRCLVP